MSVESKGFHAHSNWYFRREPDGSVRILAPDSLGPGASQRVDLDPGTWASVVASVSAGGETSASFRAAEAMHAAAPSATAMNFGQALLALKVGQRVARDGWNGKGLWVALSPGFELSADRVYSPTIAEAIGDGTGTFRPYLMIKAADDTFVPWVPSASDVLAEDWATV